MICGSSFITMKRLPAAYMGWAGLNNGKLLAAAEEVGFDVLVTGDRTLQYEQKPSRGKLALVVLSAVSWPVIQPYVEVIARAVDAAKPGTVTNLQCGRFKRR